MFYDVSGRFRDMQYILIVEEVYVTEFQNCFKWLYSLPASISTRTAEVDPDLAVSSHVVRPADIHSWAVDGHDEID